MREVAWLLPYLILPLISGWCVLLSLVLLRALIGRRDLVEVVITALVLAILLWADAKWPLPPDSLARVCLVSAGALMGHAIANAEEGMFQASVFFLVPYAFSMLVAFALNNGRPLTFWVLDLLFKLI